MMWGWKSRWSSQCDISLVSLTASRPLIARIGVQDVELLAGHRECKKPVSRIGMANRDDVGTVTLFGDCDGRNPLQLPAECIALDVACV